MTLGGWKRGAILLLGAGAGVGIGLVPVTGSARVSAPAAPSDTAFYTPPKPLPKRPAGQVIRSERIPAPSGAAPGACSTTHARSTVVTSRSRPS